MGNKIRVLVIDDSAYNRRAIGKMLESSPEIEVIDTAKDGDEGIRKALELKPDLITLDLQMPGMDGFAFLRIMMNRMPLPILVVSARSRDQNVFKALELGAIDFLAKPGFTISPDLYNIQEDLINKVLSIRDIQLKNIKKVIGGGVESVAAQRRESERAKPSTPGRAGRMRLIAIGSSTGGPTALQKLLCFLPSDLTAGVVIAQHMPPGFTRAFATRLNSTSPLKVKEAEDGDRVKPASAYLAPGGYHLILEKHKGDCVIRVRARSSGEKYVPSIDKLFSSAARVYGAEAMGVILTGMGRDGKEGVSRIKEAGGITLAESKDSAIIFGMPKEAISSGAIDKVLSLDDIRMEILKRC